ncbi:MAG: tetratricopeptide repeat protein [Vicinamibacterales bacterium]
MSRLVLVAAAVLAAVVAPSAPATAQSRAQTGTQSAATFSRDVAPILHGKCGVCHRPGGSAPFSLLTYAAARAHAQQIATVTRSGYMPPWQADGDFGGDFVGQPRLTRAELDILANWAATGAAEGDPAQTPKPPHWTDGWQLGSPDVILTTPKYTLAPEGTDVFRIFVLRVPVDGPRFVRGLEFKPGNPRVVHHANIRIDRGGGSRRFDDADPEPGYSGLIANTATYPDGHFLGWTPGQVPPLLPKGLAWRLEPGTDLVVELHLQPSGRPEPVEATIGLYFGSDPPERTPAMLRLGRQSIDIPAGEPNYVITDSFVLPVDAEVQAVQPHAHFRARHMTGTATLPDGTVRPLVRIQNWDFRWQHVYRYVTPFWLPKGTRLQMRYTYDNSAENPRNPVQPPRRTFWGQRSTDEMGDLWIQVLTRDERDLKVLNDAFRPKVWAEDAIGYERWIESEPANAALHNDAAELYLKLGRAADAVTHFRAALALDPGASGHFNLGTALTVAGDLDAAMTEYRAALALRPDYAQAHNNLGSLLVGRGLSTDAATHFQRALQIDPSNADAHYNLGLVLLEQGKVADGITHLKRTTEISPDSPLPMIYLAWLLAATPHDGLRDGPAAVRLSERAVALTSSLDPAALDVLAAALASTGDFARAIRTADQALALAPTNNAAIQARRDLYTQKRPFRFGR